jgi:hypothetical protein
MYGVLYLYELLALLLGAFWKQLYPRLSTLESAEQSVMS